MSVSYRAILTISLTATKEELIQIKPVPVIRCSHTYNLLVCNYCPECGVKQTERIENRLREFPQDHLVGADIFMRESKDGWEPGHFYKEHLKPWSFGGSLYDFGSVKGAYLFQSEIVGAYAGFFTAVSESLMREKLKLFQDLREEYRLSSDPVFQINCKAI